MTTVEPTGTKTRRKAATRRPHPLADDIRRVMEDGLPDPLWTTNSLARTIDPKGTRHWYALQAIIKREAPAIAASLGLATYRRGPVMYFAAPGRKIAHQVTSLVDQIAAVMMAASPRIWTAPELAVALFGPRASQSQIRSVARYAKAAAESIGWTPGRYSDGRARYDGPTRSKPAVSSMPIEAQLPTSFEESTT